MRKGVKTLVVRMPLEGLALVSGTMAASFSLIGGNDSL